MGRTVGIGIQDFGKIIKNNYFYIDKSSFIREWWESGLEETARAALTQIEKKRYREQLIARGIKREHIRCYGFAFLGKARETLR